MSCNYEIQIDIYPCPFNDEPRVTDVLLAWGFGLDSDTESFNKAGIDGWSYWGSIQLTAGQGEREKHNELRVLLPDRALTTRWRCVDDQPWDDVIETEPLESRLK